MEVLNAQKARQALLHNFTDDFRICNSIKDSPIQRRNKLYSKKTGLKTIRIHDFRHSHASVLANNNINIQEVARRLGHARIEITWNTYCHLYPKEEEKAVEVLNSFS
jgi:integrase